MNSAEGQGLVIKLAQKNKETQTTKLGTSIGSPHENWFGAAPPTSPPSRAAYTVTSPVYTLAPPPSPTSPQHQHRQRQLGPTTCQFYMDREEELYRQACQLKGIGVDTVEIHHEEDDSIGSEEDPPSKIMYRYTLDEMKSYNPYRSLKS